MFKKIQNVFKKRTEGVQGTNPNVQSNGANKFHDTPRHYYPSTQIHQRTDHSNPHVPALNYLPIEVGSTSNSRVEYPNMRDQKRSAIIDPVVTPGCPPGGICSDEEMRYPRRRGENFRRDEMPADEGPPNLRPAEMRPAEVRPSDVRPSDMRPSNLRPVDMRPVDMKPVDMRPVDMRPADARPADMRPADMTPADMKPADVRPIDMRPADVRPADVRPTDMKPTDMRPAGIRPADVRHPQIPDQLPRDTKYDQLPADSKYNQSPCDPYAVSPRSWLRHSPRERRPPTYEDRGTGPMTSDECNDEPRECKSDQNRGRFPSSSHSKARPRVGADGKTDPQSTLTDRNLLDEVAEFYHQFPDLHTEVRIMVANNVTIYMLGTNHADPQCPIDVSNIVRRIRPQAVLIELCAWRACGCKDHVGNVFQTKPEFNFRYLRKVISQIGFLPAMIFFTDAFNEHNASVRGQLIDYGAEFAVAAQACKELTNCKIVLADREIPITVKRQASAMGNWRGLKMSALVTLSLIFKGRMKKYLLRGHKLVIRDPHFYQIVVLERDIFLTYMIQATASLPFKQPKPKIVAVVGQGHLNGIQSFWGRVVPQVLPLILKADIDM